MRPPLSSSSHAPAVSASGRSVRGATGRGDGKPTVETSVRNDRRIGPVARRRKLANAAKKQAAVDTAFERLERAGFAPHVLRARPKGPALGRVWTLASLGAPVKRAVAKAIAQDSLFDYLEKERQKRGKVRQGVRRGRARPGDG
jgi:hypothetical protein